MDREGLVAQPSLALDLGQLDQIFCRDRVELAPALARIDEGAKAHLGQEAGTARRDLTIKARDAAERQVVGFNGVVEGQFPDLRDERPVPADHALEQARMRQSVEAALLAIAGRGRKDEGQAGGLPGREVAPLQRENEFVRRADADEP